MSHLVTFSLASSATTQHATLDERRVVQIEVRTERKALNRGKSQSIQMKLSQAFLIVFSLVSRTAEAFVAPQKLQAATMAPRAATVSSDDAPYSYVKGVVFDVDGTLADSWKLGYDATKVVLERNGVPQITEHEYHEGTKYSTPDRLARHAGLEPGDAEYEEVGRRLGEEFDNLYVDLVNMETACFYPGISSLLDNIPEDVVLGALTNACEKYAHAVLKTNCPVLSMAGASGNNGDAIYSRFESVRGADTVPTPKPSPDGLFDVCKDLGLKPEECIYVGDSPSDGVAAKAAGMGAIGVLWGSHSEERVREAPFDHVCSTVKELQALMPRR